MKGSVYITFKSPDAVYYALERIHPDQHDEAMEIVAQALGSIEYVDIEVDLETGEAKIAKR